MKGGHQCVVFNWSPEKVKALVEEGAVGAASLVDLVQKLQKPRVVWLIMPAAVVDTFIADLLPLLEPGDILIDGGNSCYVDDIPRTSGREKVVGTSEQGYLHCGPNGAGHFVKMVHNGIEYGLMAAYAEGLSVLRAANIGNHAHDPDAETTPLRAPERYQYDFNLGDIAEVWRRGSVIASWLLDLTADALTKDSSLAQFAGRVSDSGEGRWTIQAAIDEGVPVPVLTTALYARFACRGEADFQGKVLSAMRFGFGGHLEKPAQ